MGNLPTLHATLFVALLRGGPAGGEWASSEVAFHHVAPSKHFAPTRAPKLEFWLVDNDVLPDTALVDSSATSTVPLALDHLLLANVVFPNVISPMLDADVVNVQPLRATSPPALDHLQGCCGTWGGAYVLGTVHLGSLRLGFHSTTLTDPFPPFAPESLDGR